MIRRSGAAASLRPLRHVIICVAVLGLAACQTTPPPLVPAAPPEQVLAGWPARKAQLQARAQFTVQGRIGVASGGDGFNGHLRWVQAGARSTVNLDGPLGVGGVRVVDDGGVLTLTDPSGDVLDSESARAELARRMGFEPPLASLRFWIQGVPDPTAPSMETADANGYLASLMQSDWTVTFGPYMQTPDGPLPQRLTAERGSVRVKFAIESWHTP